MGHLMATRDWVRSFPGAFFRTGDFAKVSSPFTIETEYNHALLPGTILRQMLSLTARIRVDTSASSQADKEWWYNVRMAVAVGIGDNASAPPLVLAGIADDRRITGTGMMKTDYGAHSDYAGFTVAQLSLTQDIDARGMRKSTPGAPLPVAMLGAQIMGTGDIFFDTNIWDMEISGYWRTLWETP